jgi:hypothetical protein
VPFIKIEGNTLDVDGRINAKDGFFEE